MLVRVSPLCVFYVRHTIRLSTCVFMPQTPIEIDICFTLISISFCSDRSPSRMQCLNHINQIADIA